MRILFTILFCFIFCFGYSQTYPINQNLGRTTSTLVSTNAIRADQGLINGIYEDTTAVNLLPYLKNYPGAQIMTYSGGAKLWYRNENATAWIEVGAGGSGGLSAVYAGYGLTQVNDSTLAADTATLFPAVRSTVASNNLFTANLTLAANRNHTTTGYAFEMLSTNTKFLLDDPNGRVDITGVTDLRLISPKVKISVPPAFKYDTTNTKLLATDLSDGGALVQVPWPVGGGASSLFPTTGTGTATDNVTGDLDGNNFNVINAPSIYIASTNQANLTYNDGEFDLAVITAQNFAGDIYSSMFTQTPTGEKSEIKITYDSIFIKPHIGGLVIDSLNTQISLTRYNVLVWDTVAGTVKSTPVGNIGGGSGANTALSNLASVSINANLGLSGNGTIDIGDATNGLNDVFFSSGSILNWNNGDVTLTHSSNALTLAGGDLSLGGNLFLGGNTLGNAIIRTGSSSNNSNLWTPSTTNLAASGFVIGSSAEAVSRVVISGQANTITANRSVAALLVNGQTLTAAGSGTHEIISTAAFLPAVINTGSATTTDATTLYVKGPPTGTETITNPVSSFWVASGRSLFGGAIVNNQGADVASVSGAIALGSDGNTFEITGTNAITLISNVGWQNGSEVTLIFTSTASLTDGTANSGTDIGMELAGNTNFTGSAGATLTLILSEVGGVQRWREKCRSVN